MGWLFEKHDDADNFLTILIEDPTNLPVTKIRIKLPKNSHRNHPSQGKMHVKKIQIRD